MSFWRNFRKGNFLLVALGAFAATAEPFDRDYLERHLPKEPREGCQGLFFYNVVEIFKMPGLLEYVTNRFAAEVQRLNPDYIAAPEARAWPLMGTVSLVTKKPAIPIRKAGKLPKRTALREEYRTAYSNEAIEMTIDPSLEGKTAVILDDGLSSGGTTLATIRLLERQGVRVVGVLAIIEYHYTPRVPEYAPWYPKTTTLFDLAKPAPVSTTIEAFETERKFLVPSVAGVPADVRAALVAGESHPHVVRRGLVLQEYVPVARVPEMIAALDAEGIPFGTADERAAVVSGAQELRLLSKSLRERVGEHDEPRDVIQVTVKGPGGLTVRQLETPDNLPPALAEKLAAVVARFQPYAEHRVRKVGFEMQLHDAQGRVLQRSDGTPLTTEIDLYVGGENDARYVLFMNGEVEFHGATQEASVAAAKAFRPAGGLFANDLTGASGVKARDIAARGVPAVWSEALVRHRERNDGFLRDLLAQFARWASPTLVARLKR